MLSGFWSRWAKTQYRRLAQWIGLGFACSLAALLGPPWYHAYVTDSMQLHATLRMLDWLQQVYLGLLIAVVPLTCIFALAFCVWRRPRLWLARGLCLCGSLLTVIPFIELVAGARLERLRIPIPRLSTSFADQPGEATVDILVIGESSAKGVPYQNWLSVGRIVAWKLGEALPGKRFPVECQAQEGFKLDQMHLRLRELTRRPDLAIIYAGHNEFSMRRHWSHGVRHYHDRHPAPEQSWWDGVRGWSRVIRLIDATANLLARTLPPLHTVDRRLVDVPIFTEQEYTERLQDFRVRLESMTAYLEGLGALVVLVIPPGNDADFEPNRSYLPATATAAEREEFERAFRQARELEGTNHHEAKRQYQALIERQPRFAEAHYRLARLLADDGLYAEADRHFVAARDCDGLPMRMISDFQNVYREVASRHPAAILIDGPAVVRRADPRHLAGDACFSDGIHPSLVGYTALAASILQALHARRAFAWPAEAPAPSLSAAACAHHFGMSPTRWENICGYSAWFYGSTAPVRFDPAGRLAKLACYDEARRLIHSGVAPNDAGIPGVGTGPWAIPREPARPNAASQPAGG